MILWVLVSGAFFLVFRSWFGIDPVTSGDLSFFYKEQIHGYLNIPFYWETFRNVGLGGASFLHQGVYLYNLPMGFLGSFFNYGIIERLIWFFPILIIGFLSPIVLAKEINIFPSKFYPFMSLIFLLNTYFLMIVSGGQLTIILAYVLLPLAFALYLKSLRLFNFKNILIFSLVFSLVLAWDFRLFYILLGLIFLHTIWELTQNRPNFTVQELLKKPFVIFIISGFITFSTHSFWLIPFLLNFNNPVESLSSAYKSSEAINFFSFADFSHTFSLLHPNWPENIFGKTYFLQSEFLVLPILAFVSILFPKKDKSSPLVTKWVLFFSLLGIFGAFLAKGTNQPFGDIYSWLFSHVPGFVMFRDSTKWYLLTVISYSILIPYTIYRITELINLKLKNQKKLTLLFPFIILFYLLFLIRPALLGQIGGTLKTVTPPQEYIELKNFIQNQPEFFRTLWVPSWQRFGFYENIHPAISAQDYLKTNDLTKIVNEINSEEKAEELRRLGVKYIIIPFDSGGELFITERKYDYKKRQELEIKLSTIKWLEKKNLFSNIAVFELKNPKDHFWLEGGDGEISYKFVNPTKYIVEGKTTSSNSHLIFSEYFDPLWTLSINSQMIKSQKSYGQLNSFIIPLTGNWQGMVEFIPQRHVYLYIIISGLTLIGSLIVLFFVRNK